jgi:hypothetical protein
MIETNLASDLCDDREAQYLTPLSHHERHLVGWVLEMVTSDPVYAERFDRERWTRSDAA